MEHSSVLAIYNFSPTRYQAIQTFAPVACNERDHLVMNALL